MRVERDDDYVVPYDPDLDDAVVDEPAWTIEPDRRTRFGGVKRQPAPKASTFWRFVFPAMSLVIVLVAGYISYRGAKLVLDGNSGEYTEAITDPTAPGFEAFVEPTDSMLIVHTDLDDQAVGYTVAALATEEGLGGTVLHIPADVMVPIGGDCGIDELCSRFLSDTYAEGGLEGARAAIAALFGVNFSDATVLDTTALNVLLSPSVEIELEFVEDVRIQTAEGPRDFLEGTSTVSAEDVALLFSYADATELSTDLFLRQQEIWVAWLDALRASDPLALPDLDLNVVRLLQDLSAGTSVSERLPLAPRSFRLPTTGELVRFIEADVVPIEEMVVEMFPFPIPEVPGDRLTVRLLNGVGDFELNETAREQLVSNGATVSVIGNSLSFDVANSSIEYSDPVLSERVDELASALGVTDVVLNELSTSVGDLTLVLGSDFGS